MTSFVNPVFYENGNLQKIIFAFDGIEINLPEIFDFKIGGAVLKEIGCFSNKICIVDLHQCCFCVRHH